MEKFRILFYIILCFASLCLAYVEATLLKRPLKKKCRILPAGGLGVSPSFKKSPKIGGYRGLIESISAVSFRVQITIKGCLIGASLHLLNCFNILYNDNRRRNILRMTKYMSWEQVGIWWIWKNHGYIRMLLISVAVFRLFSPTLLN